MSANWTAHHTATIDENVHIGSGTRIWHYVHISEGVTIGESCVLGQNVMIGLNVKIGNGCRIQNNVSVYTGVILEDDVFCGPSCVFTNVLTPRAFIDRKREMGTTIVRTGASIGANATIVCGAANQLTEIGSYSMIAAGAVVTASVPNFALMIGVPARRAGWVSKAGEVLGQNLICPRDNSRYKLENEQLIEVEP